MKNLNEILKDIANKMIEKNVCRCDLWKIADAIQNENKQDKLNTIYNYEFVLYLA